MLKNQDGFHHVVAVVVILVLGVVGFVGFRVIQNATDSNKSSQSNAIPKDAGPNYEALPACDGDKPVLTRSPIDLSVIDSIAPLGNINPPEHTIPTTTILCTPTNGIPMSGTTWLRPQMRS